MSRSNWKFVYFKKKIKFNNLLDKNLTINNYMLKKQDLKFFVHTGNNIYNMLLNYNIASYKVGTFFLNKKIVKHAKYLHKSSKKVKSLKVNKLYINFYKKFNYIF